MSFLFRGILVASDDPSRRVVPDRHSRRHLQGRPDDRARVRKAATPRRRSGRRHRGDGEPARLFVGGRDGATASPPGALTARGSFAAAEDSFKAIRRFGAEPDWPMTGRATPGGCGPAGRSVAQGRAGLAEPGRPWRRRQAEQRAIRRWRPTCLSDACVRPFGRPRHRGHQSRPDLLEAQEKRSRRVPPWLDTTARCLTRAACPRPQGRCGCCGRRRRRR